MKTAYKVKTITEGRIGALLFGGSNMSTTKIENALNEMDKDGYEMVFMVSDKVRNFIFASRERVVLTFKAKE